MAVLDLTAELTGTLPGLSPILAESYVRRAWTAIQNERLWSFLMTDAAVMCPGQITTGTFSITQYATTVTANAAASAALLAQAQATTQPGLTNLQIRFGATSPVIGQVYNIIAVDVTNPATLVLTLDRMVLEATTLTSGYQVYRCYITPPVPNFLKWESIVDMANGRKLRLDWTSGQFDARDPQRQSQGLAYYCGAYEAGRIDDIITGVVRPNPNQEQGAPIYELWPHPTNGQTFYTRFRRRSIDFVQQTDTQPAGIPDALILARALAWHAYPFAMANTANFPTMKGQNWPALIATTKADYRDLLLTAKRNDNDAQLSDVWNRGHGLRTWPGLGGDRFPFPIDAAFLQRTLVNF